MLDHLTIINRNAGSFCIKETNKLSNILDQNIDGELIITENLDHLEEIIIKYNNSKKPQILGIGGGDGTAAHTLSLVKEHWGEIPDIIAPYAYGTMNNWAIPFNLYDCLTDKLKVKTGLGKTKAIKLAEYISQESRNNESIKTDNLGLLKVNNQHGFNVGFGLIPKLVWLYYGRTMDQYLTLQNDIVKSDFYNNKDIDPNKLITCSRKDNGLISTIKTGITSVSQVLFNPKNNNDFYSERLSGKFYIDGKRHWFPNEVISVYMASYEQINLGIKNVWFKPTPQARSEPKKMQIVISWDKPTEIIPQLPGMFFGKHLKNSAYFMASDFVFEPHQSVIGQVDAEYIISDGFKVSLDQTLNIISPYK